MQIGGQVVPLHRHTPHFGGTRFYFGCLGCDKRFAVLYLRNGEFRCRSCARVAYGSTRQSPCRRAASRIWKLRALFDGTGPLDPMPSRPKGMRWRTYVRLIRELEAAQAKHRQLVRQRFDPVIRDLRERVMRISPKGGHPPSEKRAV